MQHHSPFHTAANSTTPVTEGEKILLKKKKKSTITQMNLPRNAFAEHLKAAPLFLLPLMVQLTPLMLSALQPCSKAIYNP